VCFLLVRLPVDHAVGLGEQEAAMAGGIKHRISTLLAALRLVLQRKFDSVHTDGPVLNSTLTSPGSGKPRPCRSGVDGGLVIALGRMANGMRLEFLRVFEKNSGFDSR